MKTHTNTKNRHTTLWESHRDTHTETHTLKETHTLTLRVIHAHGERGTHTEKDLNSKRKTQKQRDNIETHILRDTL